MLFWVYGSHADEAYSSQYGSDKGLAYALSFMALELIFSRIAPQKTKCSVSLVYHVVDVVVPVQSCCMVLPRYLVLETESRVWPYNSYE